MADIMQKVFDDIAEQLAGELGVAREQATRLCQSPIEEAFLVAVFGRFLCAGQWLSICESRIEFDRAIRDSAWSVHSTILPQAKLGGYTVDFLLSANVPGLPIAWLAVECDGHDFHEKTKAQASNDKKRDRFLQHWNIPVYRFSGSDIFNRSRECADQVFEHIDGRKDPTTRLP